MPGPRVKNYYEVEAIVHAKRNGGGKEYTIIDVRDPDEREAEGFIPSSINIPAYEFKNVMKMSGSAFEKKYGVKKPGKKDHIVLYCRTAQRSSFTADYLANERYNYVSFLSGGYGEWEKHQQNADDADL